MVLGGFWHGASWNFIIWGVLHGALLGFERSMGRQSLYFRMRRPVRVALTFGLVVIAWVFFRAETLPEALSYLGSMFTITSYPETSLLLGGAIYTPYYLYSMGVAALVVWCCPQTWDWTKSITWGKSVIIVLLLLVSVMLLTLQSYNPFIYFNF